MILLGKCTKRSAKQKIKVVDSKIVFLGDFFQQRDRWKNRELGNTYTNTVDIFIKIIIKYRLTCMLNNAVIVQSNYYFKNVNIWIKIHQKWENEIGPLIKTYN